MNELALFAGAGGGVLGGHLLGWRTVCAVERDLYAASVLAARQNDGQLPAFPIWSDVCSFDGKPWRGIVDIISGGFPCQDISAAGKGTGITGERSGLWSEFARIIGEVGPRFAFVENSPMLTTRGLGTVLGDLASLGYDAEWCVLGADDCGAPHQRERIWILAYSSGYGHRERREAGNVFGPDGGQIEQVRPILGGTGERSPNLANARKERLERTSRSKQTQQKFVQCSYRMANTEEKRNVWGVWELEKTKQCNNKGRSQSNGGGQWWATEPAVGRVADGVAHRVDRISAIGNGQVPIVAATAFKILYSRLRG